VEAVPTVLGTVGLLIAIAANVTRVAEFVEARRRSRRAAPADGPAETDRGGPVPAPANAAGAPARGQAAACRLPQAGYTRANTIAAFCPPKAKLVDSTTSTRVSRASLGT
jgi:hypothetical protein